TIFANTGSGPENFLNLIDATAAELLNGGSGNIGNNTPAMPAEEENAVMRHFRKWRILGTYVWPNPAGFAQRTTYQSEVNAMKNFVNARLAWIDDQNFVGTVIYRPPVLSSNGGSVPSGTALTIAPHAGTPPGGRTYATGTLYYTLDGSDPRLHGGAVAPGAIQYTGPITLTGPATVNARLLSATGNNWSPIANAEFTIDTVPASAANLVVSEVMYHPRAATPEESAAGYGENDFEFVELLNIGNESIDLTGCELQDAVNFDFDVVDPATLTLAPGARLLVVANLPAFIARYGDNPATKIAGVFSGSLSNSGELFTLRAASGELIAQFTWSDVDPWPTGADAGGASLLLSNPAPNTDYTAASWRAGAQVDGSPGLGELPIVVTLDATELTATSAKLNAEINPNGNEATVEFVISELHYPAGNLPGTITPMVVSQTITGLAPHTAYTVTAQATNAVATRAGAPVIFNTMNRLPEAQAKAFHFPNREPVALDILGTSAFDPDGDSLTITEVGAGQQGVVTTDGQKIFYAPSAEYTGNDSFTYTVSDGFGGVTTGTITLENAAPIAQADSVESNGEPVTFDPRSNDTDADNDPLSILSVTQGSAGTVTITETGSLQYTPGAGFVRRDNFSYTITDGSAIASATVQVRTTEPRPVIGAAKGAAIPGEPPGAVYGDLGVPTMGVFSGSIVIGSVTHRAIFAPDGSVRLKEGDPAPGIVGAVIAKVGEPSGQAVIVTLSGTNVRPQNDTALYVGLIHGPVQLGAREGSIVDGSSLKKFLSIDGNGATTFFRCKLSGAGVKAGNDIALGAVLTDGTMRLLTREGKIVGGKTIAVLGTLVGARGTLAESRWRAGEDAIGVRLTLDGKTQAVYTIPASATSSEQWTLWAQTGDDCVARGKAATFGLPGFGPNGAAYTTQLLRERFGSVGKANDTLLLGEKVTSLDLLADESGSVPGADGTPLPGLRFKKFFDPVAGADGRIAFIATVTGQGVRGTNRTGIWFTAGDGSVRLLARAGDLAPGGGRWASFESLSLPDGAESAPLFTGLLAIDGSAGVSRTNRSGLWAADSTGTLHLLLRAGRPLTVNGAERTIKSFVALAPAPDSLGAAQGFDQEGNVTALVTFSDG
ncbi:MAG TPA: Ig-like domain-containing protein, partial [Chthoniobacteraceae bacterium]|nr:Ig-like domain-containing protein [Chthoniobacteraceae bacterium]